MILNELNVEIDTVNMRAEGSEDFKLKLKSIVDYLNSKGYTPFMIEIVEDKMMGCWRWECGIKIRK